MAQSSEIAWSETACSDDEEKLDVKMRGTKKSRQSSASLHSSRIYNEVEMVKFILSSTTVERVWEVHTSILEPQSTLFKRVIEYGRYGDSTEPDPCQTLRGLERTAPATNTFFLTEMKEGRFEAFVQAVRPTLGRAFTAQELVDILVVANDWGFKDLRAFTMRRIPAVESDPLEMVALCRRTKISEWLLKPYGELAMRLSPLTRFEVRILGPSASAAIYKAREAVLHRRMALIRSDEPPDWMWSLFWHRTCWRLLSDSWYGILTKSQYADMELKKALVQEMEAIRGKEISKPLGMLSRYTICGGCNVEEKLRRWMNVTEDMQIAARVLKEELGDNMDIWLLHSESV